MNSPSFGQYCIPNVVAIDWDGTLRAGFLVFDWARYLTKRGQFERSVLVEIDSRVTEYREGKLRYADIAESIPRLYAAGLADRNTEIHANLAREFVESRDFIEPLTWLADTILRFIKSSKLLRAVIISGGPQSVLDAYARAQGVDVVYGLRVLDDAGTFTPQLLDNPAIAIRKAQIITAVAESSHIALAIGDSESDIPMLEFAMYRIVVGSTLRATWSSKLNTLLVDTDDSDFPSVAVEQMLRKAESLSCTG